METLDSGLGSTISSGRSVMTASGRLPPMANDICQLHIYLVENALIAGLRVFDCKPLQLAARDLMIYIVKLGNSRRFPYLARRRFLTYCQLQTIFVFRYAVSKHLIIRFNRR